MTRRMLINAQNPEVLRVAIIENSTLENLQIEVAERGQTRGNIYRGVIANIQPSLNAAFIDYGAERHGFLPIQDVVSEAYYRQPKGGRAKIEEVLDRGRPIVVQVSKEPEGQKGAALTTNLSFAGRYLVLTPFDGTRGVSRKVEDEETRKQLKQQVAKLEVPKGCGVIVRTNALDQNKTALSRDLAALLRLWKRVGSEARQGKGTKLIYSDQDLILQALRDYLDTSIGEILIDDDAAYARAEEYLRAFMPRGKTRLLRYQERAPLFSKFDLETQIDNIYERSVTLPSGGSIVIDRTEALTAVDVNSGKSTRAASQEETAVHTNLEAAKEVARQLQLRDIGGLVVVDFIDMRSPKNRRKLEKTMRDAMKADKARSSVGRISSNGLLEINRQRIHQALHLRTHRPCPTCDGTGRIASPEMVSLNLLRRIEARAATSPLKRVRVELHPELADAFQNGRRQEIAALEREFDLRVEVISSPQLHRPEQEIEWLERKVSDGKPALTPKPQATVLASHLAVPEEPPQRERGDAARQEGSEPGEPRTRRRRRPRSRKPKTASNGDNGKSPEAPARKQPEDRTVHAEPAAAPAEAESTPKPQKRRARRRRSRRSSGESATSEGA